MNKADVQAQSAETGEQELTQVLSDWASTLALRFRGSLRLALAETKLAVTTFVLMVFLAVLSAGAVIMAWSLLLAALIQALSLAGVTLAVAIAILSVAHVLLAWMLWRLANRLGRHMHFRATRGLLES